MLYLTATWPYNNNKLLLPIHSHQNTAKKQQLIKQGKFHITSK